jgi:hypothetical protein
MSEHAPVAHGDEPQAPPAPTVDVRALRAAAAEATPGPWSTISRGGNGGTSDYAFGWDVEGPPEPHVRGQFANRADAAYIAAFHPATALALLDRLEALEAALIVVFHREDGSPVAAICAICNKMLCSDRPEEDARFPGATEHARNCRVRGLISSEMARAALGREEASRE